MYWLLYLLLVAVEAGALAWWLRKEFYPLFFSGWAALIYSAVLAADGILVWLVSMISRPGGTLGTQFLAVLGIILVVVTYLMTVFFRWVVKHDMNDLK